MTKTVIIGSVAGGATAAARLRRLDSHGEIVVFEQGAEISYANCGMPYYLGGVIGSRSSLILQKPNEFAHKFDLKLQTRHRVEAISADKKIVVVENLDTGDIFEESFDKLIIATGSSPIKPKVIPGIDLPGIYSLWNMSDTDMIMQKLSELANSKVNKTKSRAIIVGGGFIGLELAENFQKQGLEVTIIERLDQILATLDKDMADFLASKFRCQGINLKLSSEVKEFVKNQDGSISVKLGDNSSIEADVVILSLGVRPNSKLAIDAGLTTSPQGGIVVNEYMQTSNSDIYAVGDVVAVNSPITNNLVQIPLAGPANRQARICASHIANIPVPGYKGTYGTGVVKVGDFAAATVGLNEKQLIALNMKKDQDYFSVFIVQKSHAGYYPGATDLFVKGFFDKSSGRILGAQALGKNAVDKVIDAIATAMFYKGTYEHLTQLELAYAPPFGSAKSVVNMLGFVAQNKALGLVDFISVEELDKYLGDKALSKTVGFIDVREQAENDLFSIPGFLNIPLGELKESLPRLNKDIMYVVTCAVGVRAYNAARMLQQEGFKVKVLAGGTLFYQTLKYKVETKIWSKINEIAKDEIPIEANNDKIEFLDCSGLQCPGPIVQLKKAMNNLKEGQSLKVRASDDGFARDVVAFAKMNSYRLNSVSAIKQGVEAILTKSEMNAVTQNTAKLPNKKQTIVVFSDDLDKVMASLVIANGALAAGLDVTIFFTFWGLNVLREKRISKHRSFMQNMFSWLNPKGITKLGLSKFNFFGLGSYFMKRLMKQKNISSPQEMLAMAKANGAKIMACSMSMEIMGIDKSELMPNVEIVGVAAYLEEASNTGNNLFI
jgi:NADPH-dependent 2,4-dienoyl-CoA reductase/sulfur reductase-like enzyme/peroxiredoxin family protein/TusA-related sulfurtransferase/rhodanese-related sulfurtransferase